MRIIIWGFCVWLFSASVVHAQSRETYQGPFTLNKDTITGEANYRYFLENKDTIFDGSFEFQRVRLNTLKNGNTEVNSFEIFGKFEENKKSGTWVYFNKRLVPSTNVRVSEYDVSYPARGRSFLIQSRFKNGAPSGDWTFLKKRIEAGAPSDTLRFGRLAFLNEKLNKAVFLKSADTIVEGRFTNNLLDGDWTFNAHDSCGTRELKTFDKGRLQRHRITLCEEEITFTYPWLAELDTALLIDTLEYSQLVTDIIALSLKSQLSGKGDDMKFVDYSIATNLFVQSELKDFWYDGKIDVWNAVGQPKVKPTYGQMVVNQFPFEEGERAVYEELIAAIDSFELTLKLLKDNPYLEIGKYAYSRIAILSAVLSEYKKHTDAYKHIRQLLKNDALLYIPRKELLRHLIFDVTFPDFIAYELKESQRTESYDFVQIQSSSLNNIEGFRALTASINKEINNLSMELDVLLEVVRKELALTEFEEDMVIKKDSINKLFAGAFEDFNDYHRDVAEEVKGFTERQFKTYINLDVEQKREVVDDYIACFQHAIRLYEELSDLPRKLSRLDDVYTRTVWNAFLMVDMDERVKERVYEPVVNILYPYLINELKKDINCEIIKLHSDLITEVYSNMLDLRDVDTRDLERLLRRERNPYVILENVLNPSLRR